MSAKSAKSIFLAVLFWGALCGGCLIERPLELPISSQTQSVLLFFDQELEDSLFAASVDQLVGLPLAVPPEGSLILLQYEQTLIEMGVEPGWVASGAPGCGRGRAVPPASTLHISESIEWRPLAEVPPALAGFRMAPFDRVACAEQGWFTQERMAPRCVRAPIEPASVAAPEEVQEPSLPSLCEGSSACSKILMREDCGDFALKVPSMEDCVSIGSSCPDPDWPTEGIRVSPGLTLQEVLESGPPAGSTILLEAGQHTLTGTLAIDRDLTIWGACASDTQLVGRLQVLGGALVSIRNLELRRTIGSHGEGSVLQLDNVILDGENQMRPGVAVTGTVSINRALFRRWSSGVLVASGGQVSINESEFLDNAYSAGSCLERSPFSSRANRFELDNVWIARTGEGVPLELRRSLGALDLHGGQSQACAAQLKDIVLSDNLLVGVRVNDTSTATVTGLVAQANLETLAVTGRAQLRMNEALVVRTATRAISVAFDGQARIDDLTLLDTNPARDKSGVAIVSGTRGSLELNRALLRGLHGVGVLAFAGTASITHIKVEEQTSEEDDLEEEQAAIKIEEQSRVTINNARFSDVDIGVFARNTSDFSLVNAVVERARSHGLSFFINRAVEGRPMVKIQQVEVRDAGLVGLFLQHGSFSISDLLVAQSGVGVQISEEFIRGSTPDYTSEVDLVMSRFRLEENNLAISVARGDIDSRQVLLSQGHVTGNDFVYRIERGCQPLPEAILGEQVFFEANDTFLVFSNSE